MENVVAALFSRAKNMTTSASSEVGKESDDQKGEKEKEEKKAVEKQ